MAQITLNSSGVASSGSLLLQTNGTTTQATLDTSGNLGLGVTPSAWGGTSKALQFSTGAFEARSASFSSNTNAYFNSGWLYVGTGRATLYNQTDGQHVWYNSASGTAGNTITFTQAMTLDASGKLGIGTTSPQEKLQLEGSGSQYMRVKTTTTNADIYFGITSSSVGYVGTGGSDPLAFYTGGTERARIDSSGNLLVGTTSNLGRLSIVGGGNTGGSYAVAVYNSDSSKNQFLARNDGFVFLPSTAGNTTGSAANLYIDSANGAVYRSTSSLKYKQNVQNAIHGLSEVMQLRSVIYEGKSETDAGKTFGGLIAEEVHAVGLTEFVQYAEDGTPDALAYGNMVSLCIKAIQELNAKFEAYKAAHP